MNSPLTVLALILGLLAPSTLTACGGGGGASADAPTGVGSSEEDPASEDPGSEDPGSDGTDPDDTPALTSFTLVDTGQSIYYSDSGVISAPSSEQAFFGQDPGYAGAAFQYTDNGDGTVTDETTGLMWQQDPGAKVTFAQAVAGASSFSLAGHDDWRLPTIKELYSLMNFSGITGTSAASSVPYIDTNYFDFEYGDESIGERFIDSQWVTSTEYVTTTMNGDHTVFGVNFADGRIKGYGTVTPMGSKTFFRIHVRGGAGYGEGQFVDNGDGTVTDAGSGLMWMQGDSGSLQVGDAADGRLNWQEALAFAEGLVHAGHSDWRLPNAKELQALVDYTRSPRTTGSAAIDPIFQSTMVMREDDLLGYGWYWTGTTHMDGPQAGAQGVYVCFGEALGYMNGVWLDVHGAGAQRSDPKSGDASDFPTGRGPQGDAIRIDNLVRCVRDVK